MRLASSRSAAGDRRWSPAPATHCLTIAARHLGIELASDELGLPSGEGGEDLPTAALLSAAGRAGLRAEARTLSLKRLARLGTGRLAIVRFRDGSAMVFVRIEPGEGGPRLILEDPNASSDALLVLDTARFSAAFTGEAVVVRRGPIAVDDTTVPFGLPLIAALVLQDRRIVAEIAASALALSLIALAPIVFLRLVTVRVLQHRSFDTLFTLSAAMLGLIAIETALGWCRRTLADRLVVRVDVALASRVFAKLLSLPIDYFEIVPAGLTLYRVNLLHKVRTQLLTQLFTLALDAGVLVVFIPVMVMISVQLTAMILALFAVILAWIALMLPGYRQRAVVAERAEAARGTFLFQSLTGMRTVKTLALDARQRSLWKGLTREAAALRLAAANRGNLLQSVITVLERLLIVGSMAGGAALALRDGGVVSLTTLFAFVLLAQRVVAPLQQIAQMVQQFDDVRTAVDDLARLVNQPGESGRSGHGVRSPIVGEVAFSGLRFRYRGAATPALKDVSFTVRPGMTFGIMGRSGSGKTTITRLLQRLHADYQGTIRVDGVEVREYDVDHLRSSLGVVLQDNFLFSGTIRETITAARSDAPFEAVVQAARLAGAEEFIDKLPQGYETPIYEGSPNLSGGQRQRLAIARALITDPRILILDEATSALDAESEAIVNANLARMASGRTTIVISHRLSSLVACDAILVLDAGEVHDIGTHHELLDRCDIYSGLWARQNAHNEAQDDDARESAGSRLADLRAS